MQQFKNSNQFNAFIRKEAERLDMGLVITRKTFVSRVFLEKLSRCCDKFIVIKGSASATTYLGKITRGICDIDIASSVGFECSISTLSKTLGDYGSVSFQLYRQPKRTPNGTYELSYEASIDQTRHILGIDFAETGYLFERQERIVPKIFEGDDEFSIPVPSFEEYLAEKLCIVLEGNRPELHNPRLKDFYDIYRMYGGQYDSLKLTQYFMQMIEIRGRIRLDDISTEFMNSSFIERYQNEWDILREKYAFNSLFMFKDAVNGTRDILEDELAKSGIK